VGITTERLRTIARGLRRLLIIVCQEDKEFLRRMEESGIMSMKKIEDHLAQLGNVTFSAQKRNYTLDTVKVLRDLLAYEREYANRKLGGGATLQKDEEKEIEKIIQSVSGQLTLLELAQKTAVDVPAQPTAPSSSAHTPSSLSM